MKFIGYVILSAFLFLACSDETVTVKIDDTKKEKKEVSPLVSEHGITVNMAGNKVVSENYSFQFVLGSPEVKPLKKDVQATKKYQFRFTAPHAISTAVPSTNKDSQVKKKYHFTFVE